MVIKKFSKLNFLFILFFSYLLLKFFFIKVGFFGFFIKIKEFLVFFLYFLLN